MTRSSAAKKKLPMIGLTGTTGSGKTTVSEMLAAQGGYVINADALSHAAIKKDKPAYHEIVTVFGRDILTANGEIDRKKLGSRVFTDRRRLTVLENIIHPQVLRETFDRIDRISENAQGYTFVVIDAPLLIETGIHRHCDRVWVITSQNNRERIMRRDGISAEEATLRIAGRRGDLAAYAHTVIENNGDLDLLEAAVLRILMKTSKELGFSTGSRV